MPICPTDRQTTIAQSGAGNLTQGPASRARQQRVGEISPLGSALAAGSAPITRRMQRPIADDVKLCCQDGPTNSPSPVRGCHKESVAAAPPCLRAALRSVVLQWGSARPSVLALRRALAWARGVPRLWR